MITMNKQADARAVLKDEGRKLGFMHQGALMSRNSGNTDTCC